MPRVRQRMAIVATRSHAQWNALPGPVAPAGWVVSSVDSLSTQMPRAKSNREELLVTQGLQKHFLPGRNVPFVVRVRTPEHTLLSKSPDHNLSGCLSLQIAGLCR